MYNGRTNAWNKKKLPLQIMEAAVLIKADERGEGIAQVLIAHQVYFDRTYQ
jgi:hypothetical protein